jgi:hypothetical protein
MKLQGAWAWLAAAAMLVWTGCHTPPTCKTPGKTRSCECAKGQTGVQQCLPERVWDRCTCSADAGAPEPGPDAATNVPMSGTGGTGPSGTGGTMQPGMPMDMSGGDDDAGSDPNPMSAGTGGTGGSQDAGGGSGGMGGGTDSGPPPVTVDAYTTCTDASECEPVGSECLTDATGLLGSACQPACKNKNECPMPAGSYTAVVACTDGLCVLDCSPSGSDLTPRSCPTGLECHVLLDTTFACLTAN